MERILLFLDDREAGKRFQEMLSGRQVTAGTKRALSEPWDLAIVDAARLEKLRDPLKARKMAAEPALLPVLLAVPAADLESFTPEPWVDEVISWPAAGAELSIRVQSLLRARRLSREVEAGQKELEGERSLLQAIFQSASEGIVVSDAQGRVIMTNPKADRLYGRPVSHGEDSQSHTGLELCYTDGSPYDPRDLPLTRAARDGETHRQVEMAVVWPGGRRRNLLINTAPVKDGRGEVTGAVGVFQDISAQKEAEQERYRLFSQLQDYAREAQRANEELQEQSESLQSQTVELETLAAELEAQSEELRVQAEELEAANEELRTQKGELEQLTLELRTEREYLHSVLEQLPAGVMIVDASSRRLTLGNQQSQEIWGATARPDTALEKFYAIPRFHPGGRPYRKNELPLERSLWMGEVVQQEEMEVERADGSRRVISVSAAPIRDDQGRIIAGVNTCLDITMRQETGAALRRAKEEWERTFDAVPDLIAILDREHRVVRCNRAMAGALGLAPEQLVGRACYEAVHGLAEPPEFCPHSKVLREGREQIAEVQELGRHFLVTATPLTDEQGRTVGSVHVARDITGFKQAEDERRAAAERVQAVLASVTDGVVSLSFDWRYNYVNEAAARFLRRQPEDLVGVPVFQAFPEARGSIFEEKFRQALEERTVTRFEAFYPPLAAWFEGRCYPSPEGISVFFTDTTERKQAEAAVQQSEARERARAAELLAVLDAVPASIFLAHDPDCRLITGSRMAYEVLGLTPGSNISKSAPEGERPENFRVMKDGREIPVQELPVQRAAAGETVRDYEYSLVLTDGTVRHLLGDAVPLRDETGRPRGSVAAFVDITQHKRAEEAVHREKNISDTTIESLPGIFYLFDSQGRFLKWNKNFEIVSGYSPEEISGMHPVDFFADEEKQLIRQRIQEVFAKGETSVEAEFLSKDGHKTPYFFTGLKTTIDQINCLIGMGIDITERRQAEAEVQRSNQRLDLQAETAARLLASVSPQEAVDSICRKVMAFLDCDAFFNFLVDEKEERLHINACAGIPEEEARRLEWLDYGVAVCGCAARDGQRIVVEDIPHADDTRVELVKSYGIQAYACHPLLVEGRVLGTLSFGTRTRSRFGADELALMQAVADQVAIAMDRKRSEETLQQSQRDLNRAQAVAHTGSWRLDVRRNQLLWSDETHRIFGIPKGTPLTYEAFLAIVHPEDRDYVDRKWTTALRGEPYDIEHRIVVGETVKWVRERAELEFDAQGQLLGGFGTTQDITERRRAEEAVRRQAELLDLAHDAIFVRDLKDRLVFWNRGAAETYGFSREEALGKVSHLLLKTEFPKPLKEMEEELVQTGHWEGELIHHTKDGRPLVMNASWTLHRDAPGNPARILEICSNITARKEAEVRVGRQNTLLAGINRVLQEALTAESEEALGRTCLAVAEELTGSKFGFITEVNQDGLLDTIAISDPGWEACKMPGSQELLPIKNMRVHGIYGKCLREGKSEIANDPAAHPARVGTPPGHPPLTAFLGVPLQLGGKIIGMIGLGNKERGYNGDDQDAVEALSVAVVEAFQHKRAQEALQQAYRDMELRVEERTADLKATVEHLQWEVEERLAAEEALRASEERFVQFMRHLPGAALMRDTRGRYLFANEMWEQVFGKTQPECLGKTLEEVWPPEPAARYRALDQEVIQGRRAVQNIEAFPSPAGERYFLASRFPILDQAGNAIMVGGIGIDITERQRAEAALREQTRLLDAFFEHALTPQVFLDKDFNFIRVNRAYAQACRRPVEDFTGRNNFELYPHEENQAIFEKVVSTKEPCEARAKPFEFPDHPEWGVTYWDWTLTPILDEQGDVDFLVFSLKDVTERQRAEEALALERSRLYSVLEKIPAHVSLIRPDYTFAYVNGEFVRLFGEPGERRCYELLNRQNPCEECQAMAVFKTGIPVVWEWTSEAGRAYQIYDYPFTDVDGSPLALEMGVDITERKQAEEKLRMLSAYARSLIEASLDPLVTISPQGKITDVNRATEEATGISRERLIGTDFSDYFTEPEKAREGYQQVLARGSVRDYPLALRQASGGIMDVLYHATTYQNEAGEVQGVFAAARDVTERKKAEEAVRAERERFYSLLEVLPASIYLQTPDHRIIFANRYFKVCFGDPAGRRCYQVLRGRQEPCEDCPAVQVLNTNRAHEMEWQGLNGRIYYNFAYPFADHDGSPLVLEMGIDITARTQAEEALRESEEKLRFLASQILKVQEQERGRLSRELHDGLGQALLVFKLQLRAVQRQLPEDWEQLRKDCAYALQYVDDIIEDIRRLSHNLSPTVLEDIGLTAAIKNLCEEFQRVHDLECILDLDEVGGLLSGDLKINLYRICQEALANISKYANARRVKLAVKRRGDKIAFALEDDGAGFDVEEVLAREPGDRGMGLAAMFERVRILGGSLEVSSRPGAGTRISFIIPSCDTRDSGH